MNVEGLKPHACSCGSGSPEERVLLLLGSVLISKSLHRKICTHIEHLCVCLGNPIYLISLGCSLVFFFFERNGMHLVFTNLGGVNTPLGWTEEGGFEPLALPAGGGGRYRRGNNTFLSLPFSPGDPSKLRKLQACHQIRAGPQLPVPDVCPARAGAAPGRWIQPRRLVFPSCPHSSFLS